MSFAHSPSISGTSLWFGFAAARSAIPAPVPRTGAISQTPFLQSKAEWLPATLFSALHTDNPLKRHTVMIPAIIVFMVAPPECILSATMRFLLWCSSKLSANFSRTLFFIIAKQPQKINSTAVESLTVQNGNLYHCHHYNKTAAEKSAAARKTENSSHHIIQGSSHITLATGNIL